MSNEIWSFIETRGPCLSDTAKRMASEAGRAARVFKKEPVGLLFCDDPGPMAARLAPYGLAKLYCWNRNLPLAPAVMAEAVQRAAQAQSPYLMLFADTPLGSDLGARVAAGLGRGYISPCTDYAWEDSTDPGVPVIRKGIYKGKAEAWTTWTTPPPYLAGVALASLEKTANASCQAPEIVEIELPARPGPDPLQKTWTQALSRLDLSEARVVIGVGNGVKPDQMPLVEQLAARIKGVVGGTRIAVHEGLIPHERQIGTTGKWLDCDLYIALGISGAPQHVMGIKAVKKIIAVNTAKEAPIFRFSHLGIVSDWEPLARELIRQLPVKEEGAS